MWYKYVCKACGWGCMGGAWGEGCMHSGAAAFTRQKQKEPTEDGLYFQFKASG